MNRKSQNRTIQKGDNNIEADENEVIRAILNQNFLPIVDSRNMMCGILTRKGVIAHLASICQDTP